MPNELNVDKKDAVQSVVPVGYAYNSANDFSPPQSWFDTFAHLRTAVASTIWPAPVQHDNVILSAPQPVKIMRTQRYAALINASLCLDEFKESQSIEVYDRLATSARTHISTWKDISNYTGPKHMAPDMETFARTLIQMCSILQQDLINGCHLHLKDDFNGLLGNAQHMLTKLGIENHGVKAVDAPVRTTGPRLNYGKSLTVLLRAADWIDDLLHEDDLPVDVCNDEVSLPDELERPPEIKEMAQQYIIERGEAQEGEETDHHVAAEYPVGPLLEFLSRLEEKVGDLEFNELDTAANNLREMVVVYGPQAEFILKSILNTVPDVQSNMSMSI